MLFEPNLFRGRLNEALRRGDCPSNDRAPREGASIGSGLILGREGIGLRSRANLTDWSDPP